MLGAGWETRPPFFLGGGRQECGLRCYNTNARSGSSLQGGASVTIGDRHMNSVKTVALLGVLSGLLLFLGEAFGGRNGLVLGLALAVGMNFFSYFFSDKIVLMTYSAQALTAEENPE